MPRGQAKEPDSTAVRVALWRALPVQIDTSPLNENPGNCSHGQGSPANTRIDSSSNEMAAAFRGDQCNRSNIAADVVLRGSSLYHWPDGDRPFRQHRVAVLERAKFCMFPGPLT